jgi:hypothetical protein
MKTSADPATRISPDAGREKTPRPARWACFATVATSWTTFAGDGLSGRGLEVNDPWIIQVEKRPEKRLSG